MTQTKRFGRCIIIDDDPDILLSAKLLLRDLFREVADFQSPEEAMAAMEEELPDVILLDANFGRGATNAAEGFHWLAEILKRDAQAVVVMITAHAGINVAVDAMKRGATDFVSKPWSNERLLATVRTAAALRTSRAETVTETDPATGETVEEYPTITDDDLPPSLTIDDVSVTQASAVWELRLSHWRGELPQLLALLERNRLPLEGVEDHLVGAIVARVDGSVVGSAVLEVYGREALLRSVAVDEDQRGKGLGIRLTEEALAVAQRRGVERVFLLTETAMQFFPKFGFRVIFRSDVPESVQLSAEFRGACPVSAIVMEKRISQSAG